MAGVSLLVFLIALAQVANETSAGSTIKKTGEEGKAYLVDGEVASPGRRALLLPARSSWTMCLSQR